MNDNKISKKQNNEVSHNLETRICKKCGRELPLTSFRLMDNKVAAPYYRGDCKKCECEYKRKYNEKKRKIKFSENLEILINRQFKEINPGRILDLTNINIIPMGSDEVFVRLMDYRDYWISNYGRMIHFAYKKYSLLKGDCDSYGVLRYVVAKNDLYDDKWFYKQKTVYVPQLVIDEFIVNPDKQNNVYIWHSGYNKGDNYYKNLYPLNMV